jgi:hypothetical protein
MADISEYSIITYERRPGHWRAAIRPIRQSSSSSQGGRTISFVTPDDYASELEAKLAAEKLIKRL